MAAAPSTGRATYVEPPSTLGADETGSLYERYSSQIFGYCLHQLGSREEAEDAVQTTFLNALRGLQRGIVPQLESAWLFKIAHNVCLSRRRSTWRRGRVEMHNLIGEDAEDWRDILAQPDLCLHLYGELELRPDRKMGHVTRVFPEAPGEG